MLNNIHSSRCPRSTRHKLYLLRLTVSPRIPRRKHTHRSLAMVLNLLALTLLHPSQASPFPSPVLHRFSPPSILVRLVSRAQALHQPTCLMAPISHQAVPRPVTVMHRRGKEACRPPLVCPNVQLLVLRRSTNTSCSKCTRAMSRLPRPACPATLRPHSQTAISRNLHKAQSLASSSQWMT